MEKIEPSIEVVELTKKIIEQNHLILEMNERLLKFISSSSFTTMYVVDTSIQNQTSMCREGIMHD
jgi:hypothetical protein